MNDRIFPLEGVRNFRDFGGYASRYGGNVKRGLLLRSGHYAEASESDLQAIADLGIHLQADLRRPDERDKQPGRWSAPNTITNDGGREMEAPHTQFLQQVEVNAQTADGWMDNYYRVAPFKPHHAELFSDWFRELAGLEGEAASVVNCAAGKDRTGILCALTHHVLGVADEDIRADYDLTNAAVNVSLFLPDAAKYFNDMLGKHHDIEVYRPFLGVHPRYLATAFAAITAESGSVDAYLIDTLGVDEAMQAAIRDRLIEV